MASLTSSFYCWIYCINCGGKYAEDGCTCYNDYKDEIFIFIVEDDDTENYFIEIANNTENAISTKGLYLTNDDDLLKWQMPAIIIREGETIRFITEDNNAYFALKRLQTNFNLSVGDVVYLTDATENIISWAEVD
ncbi:MAG: lamin tail domain-containing protein [Oscillospiraceae bacterium]|nr:lamin tail domain-containing protein [Oscillospiraceae bacterium]